MHIGRKARETGTALLTGLLLLGVLCNGNAQDKVTTLAGSAALPGAADGSLAVARFGDPTAIAVDSIGNIYVADTANNTIRKITPLGIVSTLAGLAGEPGSADGTGAAARFDGPTGIAVDAAGNVFVADTGNHTIRRITPGGLVTTVAGAATQSGADDGTGGDARFNLPLGLALDPLGNIFVADSGNHTVRRSSPAGIVTTFAGTPENFGFADGMGTNASFNNPVGLALDAGGNVFVSDANNHVIRRISAAGAVTTFAGSPGGDGSSDGPAPAARFGKPAELAFDRRGNLYVADSLNNTLRKITPAGDVLTVSGVAGEDGAGDGANRSARFLNPYGVAFDAQGHLLVTDTYNHTLRRVLVPFTVGLGCSQPGTIAVTWDAVVGKTYQLQFKAGMAGAWQNLASPVTATAQSVSQGDPSPAPLRFYRIVLVD